MGYYHYIFGYLVIAYICRLVDSAVYGPGGYCDLRGIDPSGSIVLCCIWPLYGILIFLLNREGNFRFSLSIFEVLGPGYWGTKVNDYVRLKKANKRAQLEQYQNTLKVAANDMYEV